MSRTGIFIAGTLWAIFIHAVQLSLTEARGADLAQGKRVYTEVCITCHGIDGRGPGAMKLNPPATDLTIARVQSKLDAELFKSIHDGRKNTAMGAWRNVLSDDEIRDVIDYVRTLGGGAAGVPKP